MLGKRREPLIDTSHFYLWIGLGLKPSRRGRGDNNGCHFWSMYYIYTGLVPSVLHALFHILMPWLVSIVPTLQRGKLRLIDVEYLNNLSNKLQSWDLDSGLSVSGGSYLLMEFYGSQFWNSWLWTLLAERVWRMRSWLLTPLKSGYRSLQSHVTAISLSKLSFYPPDSKSSNAMF